MLHCVACDRQLSYSSEFCEECEEAIAAVYKTDSKWIAAVRGSHPWNIPLGSIIYGSFNDDVFDWTNQKERAGNLNDEL